MTITVVRSTRDKRLWTVEVNQGVQYFTLDYHATKREAEWYARMFRKALKFHDEAKKK